jgi:ParB family chromosome partitioning protein
MSGAERADEVFALLKTLADDSGVQIQAYKGLRWFGTPAAWDVLRQKAKGEYWWTANEATKLLRYDEGSRDVLAEILIETDDWDVAQSAAEGLRHIDGPDSLEPDYLIVQAEQSGFEASEDTLDRLRDKGDVSRILEVLPKIHSENRSTYYEPLVNALLARTPLPVEAAVEMLDSDNGGTVSVAARIVGRAGTAASKHAKAITAAADTAHADWQEAFDAMLANRRGARERLDDVNKRYRWLIWACGQLEVGAEAIARAAKLPDHADALAIREAALASLGESWIGKVGEATLTELASGDDARMRAMAATELNRLAPKKAQAMVGDALDDDVSLGRLIASMDAADVRKPLRAAMSDPARAQLALPRLAALGDLEGLIAAMRDRDLEDVVRQGAIDALGTIVQPEAADSLAKFGSDDDEDEMLRKAAWRARRRVNRRLEA